MAITFKPLWKHLINHDMTREELCHHSGLSPATMVKPGKDGNVSTDGLARIGEALSCGIAEIWQIIEKEGSCGV